MNWRTKFTLLSVALVTLTVVVVILTASSDLTESGNSDEVLEQKALPALRLFLSKLDAVGVSPLDPTLVTNSVVVLVSFRNKYDLNCRMLIDQKWVAMFHEIPDSSLTRRFGGITYFGQTGADNPYRAISGGDTNRLSQMHAPNPMTREVASDLVKRALENILGRPVAPPEIFPESAYNYDLSQWCGRWWKPDQSRLNQLNVMHRITLKATGPTQAVLVVYSDGVAEMK